MDTSALTQKIRMDLPPEAFKPRPQGAWLALPWLALIVTGTWAIATQGLPWYGATLLGLAMGQAYACLGFLAHEALHGSLGGASWRKNVLGYLGFWIFGITPTLWKVWHNQVHHGHTNFPDLDPDSFGTLGRWREMSISKFEYVTALGSGHFSSYLFYLYHFSYHAQGVLWVHAAHYKDLFKGLDRRRAIVETLLIFASWLALAWILGFPALLYALVLPWLVANVLLMSYISTNHLLRPLTSERDPLASSMSLACPRWVDFLHFNFSHHVEHHLFPSMNWKFTPLVRRKLRELAKDRYLCPTFGSALRALYSTPRIYGEKDLLVDPYSDRQVSILEIESQLRGTGVPPPSMGPAAT